MTPTELKARTHEMWAIRHEYLDKFHKIVKEVYDELGGFVAGTDFKDEPRYFLILNDWIKFSFKKDGYFDIIVDPLELDCYGELRAVEEKEFRAAFEEMRDIVLKKRFSDDYRDKIWKDMGAAQELIDNEMFNLLDRDRK